MEAQVTGTVWNNPNPGARQKVRQQVVATIEPKVAKGLPPGTT